MLNAALSQAAEESSMLLGQPLVVKECDVLSVEKQGYFREMEEPSFVVPVESREEYPGHFYMVFALRDAIMMSGILLGIPPARISEKGRLMILEPDDVDAFSEIANQIIGSFNSVFPPKLPKKVHLKLEAPQKFIPETNELTEQEPMPDGDYLLFYSQLELPGQMMNRLDILIPRDLANQFDPEGMEKPQPQEEPEEQKAAEEAQGASAADAPAAAEGTPTVLILEDDDTEREKVKSFFADAGIEFIDASFEADLKQIFDEHAIKIVIIGSENADDRELSMCIKITALPQNSPPPIIMCARQWTRTGILKAVKFGANDIILKPYNSREIVLKVGKLLKAA